MDILKGASPSPDPLRGEAGAVKTPKRRMKLFYSLLAVMVIIAVAPLVFTAMNLVSINKEHLETNWKEYQLAEAYSLSSESQLYIDRVGTQLEQIKNTFEWTDEMKSISPLIQKMLEASLASGAAPPDILHIRTSDLAGNYQDETLLVQQTKIIEDALLQSFTETRKSNAFISSPFRHQSDAPFPVLVIGLPLYGKGEIRGTISAIVSLENIVNRVNRRSSASGFTIYLVDDKGEVFIATRSDVSSDKISRDHPLLQAFRDAMRRSPNTSITSTFPFERLDTALNKIPMVGTFVTIPELKWGILVEIEQAKAYSAIYEMNRRALHITIGALIGTAIIASLFAQYLTNPLKNLTQLAQRLASGDFSQKVNVRSRNELGILGDTFNKMASDLKNSMERLKHMSEDNLKMFMGTIRVMAEVIDAKDPYMKGHSERVTRYSVVIARHMGLSAEQIEMIQVGALLHDVGKIGIEDRLLGKPTPYNDEEYEIMKQHPEKGARIIAQIEKLRPIIPAIRYHHERWQGGGYPTGVSGENIPLIARIVAVADTFDAMTTDRPYQGTMTCDFALAKIYELKGTKFDPQAVEALMRAYRAGDITLEDSESPSEPASS